MADVDAGNSRSRVALAWRSRQRVTGILLAAWFLVTFAVAFFARDLDGDFLGWPFSFWVAAQGAPAVYLALVAAYAVSMARVDVTENEAETIASSPSAMASQAGAPPPVDD